MKYERIFWLDDNPGFLRSFSLIAQSFGITFNLQKLLERATFAFDYETGKQAVAGRHFDLYVLDADFPDRMSESRKQEVNNFLDELKRNETKDFHFFPSDIGIQFNNFARFYEECLDKKKKVIVQSSSRIAVARAFQIGLPFYDKVSMKGDKEIIEWLRLTERKFIPPIDESVLEIWERGGNKELIEGYLV